MDSLCLSQTIQTNCQFHFFMLYFSHPINKGKFPIFCFKEGGTRMKKNMIVFILFFVCIFLMMYYHLYTKPIASGFPAGLQIRSWKKRSF